MADKKPTKRSGASGGDRPMRRRDTGTKRDDSRKTFASDKRSFDKPRGDKAAKPRAEAKRAKSGPVPASLEKTSAFAGERIAKAMARAGVCSRRDAEDWIAAGRVAVNGLVLTSPAVNVTEADKIVIDGAPMQARERTRLFLFHKPTGLVTTASDPEGRPTVFAFLDERRRDLPRLVSVGRLDINTEGLLLLTNDGGLARTLELPATGWTRRYRVRVHGDVDQARLDELKQGVTVDDVAYAPIEARLERVQGANAWIAMSLAEGKNREIKRVMEHLGLDVTRLIRVSYGPFQLGELAEGAVEEVKLKTLREQLGKSLAELAGVDFASPLREATPAEKQEQREKGEKRPRKHVSVLRRQREEKSEKGPRARIERGATADRKGRAVVVERVAVTARKRAGEEPASRNARRFEAMRAGRGPGGAEREMERPARGAPRAPREEGSARDERRGAAGRRPPGVEGERPGRPTRPPRAEAQERRARSDAKVARQHARTPPRDDEKPPFERRPPRRDGERTPRGARWSEGERLPERPRKFDRPRDERDFRSERRAGARASDQPRASDGKPPRDGAARESRGAAPRKGPPKGPPKGRGPGKGPSRGPRRPRGE